MDEFLVRMDNICGDGPDSISVSSLIIFNVLLIFNSIRLINLVRYGFGFDLRKRMAQFKEKSSDRKRNGT